MLGNLGIRKWLHTHKQGKKHLLPTLTVGKVATKQAVATLPNLCQHYRSDYLSIN